MIAVVGLSLPSSHTMAKFFWRRERNDVRKVQQLSTCSICIFALAQTYLAFYTRQITQQGGISGGWASMGTDDGCGGYPDDRLTAFRNSPIAEAMWTFWQGHMLQEAPGAERA